MIVPVAAAMKTTVEYSLVPYDPGRALSEARQAGNARFTVAAGGGAKPKLRDHLPDPSRTDRFSREDLCRPTYSFHRTIERPAKADTGLVVDIFV